MKIIRGDFMRRATMYCFIFHLKHIYGGQIGGPVCSRKHKGEKE